MLLGLLSALQAATAPPPDIAFYGTLTAREVKVESRGRAEVKAWAEPDAGSTAQSSGTRSSRRFELKIDARIADPLARLLDTEETPPSLPR